MKPSSLCRVCLSMFISMLQGHWYVIWLWKNSNFEFDTVTDAVCTIREIWVFYCSPRKVKGNKLRSSRDVSLPVLRVLECVCDMYLKCVFVFPAYQRWITGQRTRMCACVCVCMCVCFGKFECKFDSFQVWRLRIKYVQVCKCYSSCQKQFLVI